MNEPVIPKLAMPFRFRKTGDRRAVVLEQDSTEEVAQGVLTVALYPLGFRDELPEFGISDQAFEEAGPEGIDTDDLQAAISLWEPRADALLATQELDLDELVAQIQVNLRGVDLSAE